MQRELMWMLLQHLLADQPGQNKRQLLAGLRRLGQPNLTTTDVNRALYANSVLFAHDGATPPRWRMAAEAADDFAAILAAAATALPRCYRGNEPRAWQTEALAAWRTQGRRGVVEAVTGTGKTTVGVLAAAAAVDAAERVLVLVPGRELLDQWHDVLRRALPGVRVGRFGGGHEDSLHDHSVLVAIVHSAARHQMLPLGAPGLLVADEVHRYGAPTFAYALEPGFGARLGLTATYAREDNGLIEHLEPYFGRVVAGCSYERGLTDEILAPFRVGFLGVHFSPDEQERHDEYDERARALRRRMILDHGCPEEPFGEFIGAVNRLSQGSAADPRTRDARNYLNAFTKRRQVLAECRSKQEALASLALVFATADRGLVFGETTTSAEQAAAVLRRNGVLAEAFTSELQQHERKDRLAGFREGKLKVLTAPRVLDEGIDVPQAELGVVMAGSKSKRQMIQRMGRVIRPKKDRRPAAFIVLYVRGTGEDPDNGAHEDFREQLIEVAQDIVDFGPDTSGADLLAWYCKGRMGI
ncbi:DEAD/DEAH box helicase [Micromonospora sediminimaris]|uniref:DEAD/DEAH box helicase n=1 Tax=Micromonospora sediminimaris TaxID=547162 RepID=UPI00147BA12E|nr:DEAD/DEAH box helicase [Micromonospora sediminimaris]